MSEILSLIICKFLKFEFKNLDIVKIELKSWVSFEI